MVFIMRKYCVAVSLFALLASLTLAHASDKLMTLRNKDGQEIRCTITSFHDGELSLKREDGRAFKYPLDQLDEASQGKARKKILQFYPVSVDVRSEHTSSRENSYMDIYGREHRTGNKKRVFSVKVKTFSPIEVDVVSDCFFYDGSSWSRNRINGTCRDDRVWEFNVSDTTSWHAIQTNGWRMGRSTDYMSGSKRIDLVIFIRRPDGKVLDQYATSRYAEQLIEENVIEKGQ